MVAECVQAHRRVALRDRRVRCRSLPAPSENRTQAKIDHGQCKLVCNIAATPAVAAGNVALDGGLSGAVLGKVTKLGACSMVCK